MRSERIQDEKRIIANYCILLLSAVFVFGIYQAILQRNISKSKSENFSKFQSSFVETKKGKI